MAGQSLYKLFFQHATNPIAIYELSPRKTFHPSHIKLIKVNPAYEQVMKVKAEEIVGRSFQEIWPKNESKWAELLYDCFLKKQTTYYQGHSQTTSTYLEGQAFFLPPRRAAVIFSDKTDWKQTYDALTQSKRKLQNFAAQITIAEETTRREIAADIHDRVGYSLVALLQQMRNLEKITQENTVATYAIKAQKELEELIHESRSLIFKLSPPVLKDMGLNPALESLADKTLTPHGISWIFRGQDEAVFTRSADDEVCILLYRMARELLVNIVKHAQASHVNLKVHRGSKNISVEIEDNGQGFDPQKISASLETSTGFGLFSIRERLTSLSGNLIIQSNHQCGTTITMTLPRNLKTEKES